MTRPLYFDNLDEYIADQGIIVTYKWLSRKLSVPADRAKQMLQAYLTAQQHSGKGGSIEAVYLLGGQIVTSQGTEVTYQLVPAAQVADAKEKIAVLTCDHIYSLQSKIPQDIPASLYSADYELQKQHLAEATKWGSIHCTSVKAMARTSRKHVEVQPADGVLGVSATSISKAPATSVSTDATPKQQVGVADFFKSFQQKEPSSKEKETAKGPEKKKSVMQMLTSAAGKAKKTEEARKPEEQAVQRTAHHPKEDKPKAQKRRGVIDDDDDEEEATEVVRIPEHADKANPVDPKAEKAHVAPAKHTAESTADTGKTTKHETSKSTKASKEKPSKPSYDLHEFEEETASETEDTLGQSRKTSLSMKQQAEQASRAQASSPTRPIQSGTPSKTEKQPSSTPSKTEKQPSSKDSKSVKDVKQTSQKDSESRKNESTATKPTATSQPKAQSIEQASPAKNLQAGEPEAPPPKRRRIVKKEVRKTYMDASGNLVTEMVTEDVEVSDNDAEVPPKPTPAAPPFAVKSESEGALAKPKAKQASIIGFFAKKPAPKE